MKLDDDPGVRHRHLAPARWRIAIFPLLNPAYWVLHSVAAWRTAWQMLTNPRSWEKTPHRLGAGYHDDGRLSA